MYVDQCTLIVVADVTAVMERRRREVDVKICRWLLMNKVESNVCLLTLYGGLSLGWQG